MIKQGIVVFNKTSGAQFEVLIEGIKQNYIIVDLDVAETETDYVVTYTYRVDGPTVATMAKGVASALVDWASHGFSFVADTERDRRFGICQECEFLATGNRCVKCGCFMEFKSRLTGMKCPAGKW
jgi:hypothetical protein